MYWKQMGKQNTEKTVEVAVNTAKKQGIKNLVIASNEGDTVFKVLEQKNIEKFNLICITHHSGFREAGKNEMDSDIREKLKKSGVKVYTGTHVLAGVDRSLRKKFGGLYPPEIMANTLRMFGQGTKVCVEISIMALDAGLIPYNKNIIAIGGTGRGADTAVIIRPGHSNNVFETKVIEILCRPIM